MSTNHFLGFSGMLNMGVGDFLKPVNELSACKNIQEDSVGVLKRVPGLIKANTNRVNSTDDVNFLEYYFQNTTGASRLIAGSKSGSDYVLKYRTTGDWASITNGTYSGLANAELSAVNYLDKMFIVGKSDSTYLTPTTISGTTMSTADTDLTGMPQGKYIIEYRDLLYVLNARESSTNYPSRVYFCNEPVNLAIDWDNVENFIEFGQQDGDEITGGANSNDRLVVFKNNSMWIWDEVERIKVANIGCDSHKSIQDINGTLYWFNRDGIWRWDGAKPQLISGKVQPFIEAINQTKLDEVIGAQNNLEYRLFIGNVSVRGVDYNNCWIVFDIRREKFYIRCTNHKAKSATEYIEDGKKRLYFGNDDGYVLKFTHYTDGINSDDGSEIDYFFITNTIDFGEPQVIKNLTKFRVYTLNSNNLNYAIDSDKKNEYIAGKPGQIINSNIYSDELSAYGYRYNIKFYGKDSADPVEFEGFSIDVAEKEDL